MVIMIVSAIIGSVYAYILWTVIDPDIVTKMMDMQMEKMIEKGVPEEAMDQAMAITAKFMKPGMMLAMGMAFQLFFGALLSLIIAAIFKREEPNEDPVVGDNPVIEE